MSTIYKTIAPKEIYTGEYVEKKSRFIATLTGVSDEACAREFIIGIKKKYYDARHNVSAYIIRSGDNAPDRQHSSDDGEPPGTAGKPVLDVLSGTGLTGVCMVVTRYFGGTLLGTGGLVRAYGTAAKDAIENAVIVEMRPAVEYDLSFSYANEGGVRRLTETLNAGIAHTEYGEKVRFKVQVPEERAPLFEKELEEKFSGQAEFTAGEVKFIGVRCNG